MKWRAFGILDGHDRWLKGKLWASGHLTYNIPLAFLRLSTLSSMMCSRLLSICRRRTDWPASGTTWCSWSTFISAGEWVARVMCRREPGADSYFSWAVGHTFSESGFEQLISNICFSAFRLYPVDMKRVNEFGVSYEEKSGEEKPHKDWQLSYK